MLMTISQKKRQLYTFFRSPHSTNSNSAPEPPGSQCIVGTGNLAWCRHRWTTSDLYPKTILDITDLDKTDKWQGNQQIFVLFMITYTEDSYLCWFHDVRHRFFMMVAGWARNINCAEDDVRHFRKNVYIENTLIVIKSKLRGVFWLLK